MNKSTFKNAVAFILVLSMMVGFVPQNVHAEDSGHSNSYMDNVGIDQTAEYDGYSVKFLITDAWSDGYNVQVTLSNTGYTVIDNWAISLAMYGNIVNIWNAEVVAAQNNDDGMFTYSIKNIGHNRDIDVNGQVMFGFAVSVIDGCQASFIPESIHMLQSPVVISSTDYSVISNIYGDTSNSFNGSIIIRNSSDSLIEDWTLSFGTDIDIVDLYNAVILVKQDGYYVVKNKSYNSEIKPGEQIELNFYANRLNDAEYTGMIYNIALSDVRITDLNIHVPTSVVTPSPCISNPIIPTEFPSDNPATTETPMIIVTPTITPSPEPTTVIDVTPLPTLTETPIENFEDFENDNFTESYITYAEGDSRLCVTSDIILATEINGVHILWTSNTPEVVDIYGHVMRPQNESCFVRLSAYTESDFSPIFEEEMKVIKTSFENKPISEIPVYDDYSYLKELNEGEEGVDYAIYENDNGYMDFFYGKYISEKIESPLEAQKSLISVKELIGIEDPVNDLVWKETAIYDTLIRYRFNQVFKGLLVYKKEISIITDMYGNAIVINSDYDTYLEEYLVNMELKPEIVQDNVLNFIPSEYRYIENKGIVIYTDDTPYLAWLILCMDGNNTLCELFIDSFNGDLIEQKSLQEYLCVYDDDFQDEKYRYKIEKNGNLKYLYNSDKSIYVIDYSDEIFEILYRKLMKMDL